MDYVWVVEKKKVNVIVKIKDFIMGTLIVSDNFRTSELSKVPGGYDIEITYIDGRKFIYPKVKNPESYFNYAKRNDKTVLSYKILGLSNK